MRLAMEQGSAREMWILDGLAIILKDQSVFFELFKVKENI